MSVLDVKHDLQSRNEGFLTFEAEYNLQSPEFRLRLIDRSRRPIPSRRHILVCFQVARVVADHALSLRLM